MTHDDALIDKLRSRTLGSVIALRCHESRGVELIEQHIETIEALERQLTERTKPATIDLRLDGSYEFRAGSWS